jgi:hypothetical protein
MSSEKIPFPDRERSDLETFQATGDGSEQKHLDSEKALHVQDDDLPAIQQLTVEELYDKEKYDLSTMEPGDVFVLLQ